MFKCPTFNCCKLACCGCKGGNDSSDSEEEDPLIDDYKRDIEN